MAKNKITTMKLPVVLSMELEKMKLNSKDSKANVVERLLKNIKGGK